MTRTDWLPVLIAIGVLASFVVALGGSRTSAGNQSTRRSRGAAEAWAREGALSPERVDCYSVADATWPARCLLYARGWGRGWEPVTLACDGRDCVLTGEGGPW